MDLLSDTHIHNAPHGSTNNGLGGGGNGNNTSNAIASGATAATGSGGDGGDGGNDANDGTASINTDLFGGAVGSGLNSGAFDNIEFDINQLWGDEHVVDLGLNDDLGFNWNVDAIENGD